MDVIDSNLNKP